METRESVDLTRDWKSATLDNRFICIYIEFMSPPDRLPQLPCALANLRRATRVVTHLYQEEMRKHGLDGSTQFTILNILRSYPDLTQGELAELLAVDSTTLSRTLKIMERDGWIAIRPGQTDKRERRLRLTAKGRKQHDVSRPDWERAQERLKAVIGSEWKDFNDSLRRVAEAGRDA